MLLDRARRWVLDPSRVASVDRAWLRMDDPTNLMVVNSVLLLRTPLSLDELRELILARLGGIQRMRTRVESGAAWDRWREQDIDITAHVRERELPEPGDDASLRALVSELVSAPLDPTRPMWELWLLQGYAAPELDGARTSMVLARVHHSLGDGLAQLVVLLSLTDTAPDGGPNPLRALIGGHADERVIDEARAFLHDVMPTGMRLLLHRDYLSAEGLHEGSPEGARARPTHSPLAAARRSLGFAADAGRDLASLLLRRPDSETVFRGRLDVHKRVAWSRPIPLTEVKALGRELGDTVNDVLIAAMTGGLRRYLEARDQSPDGVELRAAVPVNLRRLAHLRELGNRFGLVFLTLPVGVAEPHARLSELHRRMDALKHSVEPLVTWAILELMGVSPRLVHRLILDYFARRVSFVMTNVPGPEQALYLAGREIVGVMFWVPQSGRVSLGVSIFSYAGTLRIGVASDARLVPDPELLVAKFHEELTALGMR
jgi:WS/DGAT/MGAT family acyltransferase